MMIMMMTMMRNLEALRYDFVTSVTIKPQTEAGSLSVGLYVCLSVTLSSSIHWKECTGGSTSWKKWSHGERGSTSLWVWGLSLQRGLGAEPTWSQGEGGMPPEAESILTIVQNFHLNIWNF